MDELSATITERRRQTRNSIYRCIYDECAPISKQELSLKLSLSLPTVHQNITELLNAGLIQPGRMLQSTGGRPAQGYVIVEDARFSVGISITNNRFRLLAADLRLREITYKKIKHEDFRSIADMGKALAEELEIFLDENKLDRDLLLGVGVAVPAVIDNMREEIIMSPNLRMNNVSYRQLLEPIAYDTYIENDATSGGFAESFSHPEIKNMAYLSIEDGVGGAIMIDGARYVGANHRSGEFGHMCVEPNGRVCQCGKTGCLETYCSAARITKELGIAPEEFFEGIDGGNESYKALWGNMLSYLAIGINNVRMALDCDVVLGGFLTQYMEPYMAEIRRLSLACSTFDSDAEFVRLCCHPRRAVTLGVALHFVRRFIDNI
ncbi:MAG: ROK family protein [Oscillospiraceae bacterium]|jgi:predicted NBD/HSP70 family sugar kinase|nr:ROK family protein [Oscillospiraceae bacterium]